jgi:DNA-binding MarR family transcriptional regulator
MSEEIPVRELVEMIKNIGTSAAAVLLYLNSEGIDGECRANDTDIALALGLTRPTVSKAIASLTAAGLMKKAHKKHAPPIITFSTVSMSKCLASYHPTTTINIDSKDSKEGCNDCDDVKHFDIEPDISKWGKFVTATQVQIIFERVTGWMSIPSADYQEIIRRIEDVWQKKRTATIEYLMPFFAEQRRRYPGSTRSFWLDWAAAGEIPPEPGKNGKGKQKEEQFIENLPW